MGRFRFKTFENHWFIDQQKRGRFSVINKLNFSLYLTQKYCRALEDLVCSTKVIYFALKVIMKRIDFIL